MIRFDKLFEILTGKYPSFMQGAGITLRLAFFTVLLGTMLGLIVALLRRSHAAPLRWLMNAYIAFTRGTPLLVQTLLLVYGILPNVASLMGVKCSKLFMCNIALIFNCGAYMAEIIRSGIQSIDAGQGEAAATLGLSSGQSMRFVILPQALKVTLPAMGNEFVAIIKESSIMYAVGVYELTYQANKLASTNYFYIETMLIAAGVYFVMTFVVSKLLARLERRMRLGETT